MYTPCHVGPADICIHTRTACLQYITRHKCVLDHLFVYVVPTVLNACEVTVSMQEMQDPHDAPNVDLQYLALRGAALLLPPGMLLA